MNVNWRLLSSFTFGSIHLDYILYSLCSPSNTILLLVPAVAIPKFLLRAQASLVLVPPFPMFQRGSYAVFVYWCCYNMFVCITDLTYVCVLCFRICSPGASFISHHASKSSLSSQPLLYYRHFLISSLIQSSHLELISFLDFVSFYQQL